MDPDQTQHQIWLNDHFIPADQAKIHVQTHSFHYGVGVFEGVRCYQTEKGPIIFRLLDHTERLFRSAKILNIPIPYPIQTLVEAQRQIVNKNQLGDAYIRPLVYYDGEGYIGLHTHNLSTHVAIMGLPWKNYLSPLQYQSGIKVMTSSLSRYSANSVYSKAKSTGKYLSTVMALQQAYQYGLDDAIFLDQQGYICESTGANIFLLNNNTLYTPFTGSALDGITRDTVLVLAQARGLKVKEKNILRDDLYTADEVFLTGTAAQIIAVVGIDGRCIHQGKVGPITLSLMQDYADCVQGKLPAYAEWLTIVN